MRSVKRLPWCWFGSVFLAVALGAGSLQGVVGEFHPGAQVGGMGAAGVAFVESPEALFWNPAALAQLRKPSLTTELDIPYSLGQVRVLSLTAGGHLHVLGLAAGLFTKRVQDLFAETHLSLGAGAALGPLEIGSALRAIQLQAGGETTLSRTAWTLDLGARLNLGQVRLAYARFDLLRPELSLLGATGVRGVPLQRLGFSLNLPAPVYWSFEADDRGEGFRVLKWGVEAWYTGAFALRFGVQDGHMTMGVGFRAEALHFDIGALSNPYLGTTYRFSLAYLP